MTFQSSVSIKQGFSVPGEIFQDVAWTVLSYTLDSDGTPNNVGSTAYTITSEGVVQAGNGGEFGYAGILAIPKSYSLFGVDGSGLEPSLQLPDFTQAEIASQGMMAVILPNEADINDLIIYDNDTGTLSSIGPDEELPDGFSYAGAVVSQFTQTVGGQGLAIINLTPGAANNAASAEYNYRNIFWVDEDGEALENWGNSPVRPLPSISDVVARMELGQTYVINIPGGQQYDGAYVLPTGVQLSIVGPSCTLASNGDTMFTMDGGTLNLDVGIIDADTFTPITDLTGFASVFIKAVAVTGDLISNGSTNCNIHAEIQDSFNGSFIISSNARHYLKCNTMSGDYTDTSSGTGVPRNGLFANVVGGDISSTNSVIYGNVTTPSGSVGGIGHGIFGNTMYNITTLSTPPATGVTFTSRTTGSYMFAPNDGAAGQTQVTNGLGTLSWISN
jgi:hypothetical protein